MTLEEAIEILEPYVPDSDYDEKTFSEVKK